MSYVGVGAVPWPTEHSELSCPKGQHAEVVEGRVVCVGEEWTTVTPAPPGPGGGGNGYRPSGPPEVARAGMGGPLLLLAFAVGVGVLAASRKGAGR